MGRTAVVDYFGAGLRGKKRPIQKKNGADREGELQHRRRFREWSRAASPGGNLLRRE